MSDQKTYLTREEILAAKDIPVADVDCPEWGGSVRLRGVTAEEAAQFVELSKREDSVARMIAMAAVDAEGKQLFTEADVEQLKRKSMKPLMRLQKVAMELNGLDERGRLQAKNV